MELPDVRNVESVRDLLKDLGEVYIKDNAKLARNVIYSQILRKGCIENEDKVPWREDFANYCYNLRYNGSYDDTNILEDAVVELEEEEVCDRLMKFVTLLSGSIPHATQQTGIIPTIPQVQPHHVLPDAQMHYHGDTRAQHNTGYLLYRDQLFEAVSSCPEIEATEKMLEGFPTNSTVSRFIRPPNNKLPLPKATLTGQPVIAPQTTPYQIMPPPPSAIPSSSDVEPYSRITPIIAELPALPAPSVTGIFRSLSRKKEDLPICTGPLLRSGVGQRYQVVLRDACQRFVAIRPPLNLATVSDSSGIESDADDDETWEEAFNNMDKEFPTPTYELAGRKVLQERPYLTESGCQIYTRLCVLLCSPYSDLDIVTEQHVLYQCNFVLLGIPTSIFQFDKTKVEFVPLQNICYTGVSPDSLVDCLYSIAYSGTLYLRLKMFCDQYSTVECYGNIVKGLVCAVEQYLNMYQAFLNQIPIASLIQLIWKTKDLTSQLEFLCNLLLLEEGLPIGTDLIDYLYQTAEILTSSPYYKIMLSLIRAALAPYVKFLELWLCEGRVWDDWDEFNVSSHHEWMNNKDYLFWQYAYTEREEVKLPSFLSELREQLVNTGKLINLLRLCVPDHPLSISKIRPPGLQLTFNDRNITHNMQKWFEYRDALESELQTQVVVREMKRRQEEERKMQKIVAAKQDNRRRMALIMEEAGQLRTTVTINKRQELERLQEQMLERAEQRAAMLEAERKEDKERIEMNQTQQYELIGRVRAQLEEYYTTLTREKAKEERRCLWRIQRMKLNRLRGAHLMLEMSNLNHELRQTIEQNKTRSRDADFQEVVKPPPTNLEADATTASSTATPTDVANGNPRSRKTWEQPININIDIAVGDGENIKLQGVNVSNDEVMPFGVANNKGDISDDDSEISFTRPANVPDSAESVDKEKQGNSNDRKFEPDGQMKKILYGKSESETAENGEDSDVITPKSEKKIEPDGQNMKNILYGKSEFKNSDERKFEPDGQMKEILYGKSESEKAENGEGSDVITPKSEKKFEPDGQMKNILYGKSEFEEGVEDADVITHKPEKKFEPDGQMKELLYGKSDVTEASPSNQVSRLDKEPCEMKDILYSTSTADVKKHVVAYEPKGQMKELLYGDQSSPTTSRKPSDETETGTESETMNDGSTPTPIGKRAKPVDRMKEILYGNGTVELEPETSPRKIDNTSLSDDSGIEPDYQVQPIQLTYPELESKPNPNIITDRLTRHYVAEETVNESEVEKYRTLEIILRRLLLQPLLLQTHLVNTAAVTYFVDELKINDHFDALRSYLCMNDGMFGDSLSKGLFNMIDSGIDLITSPAKLNSVLHEAMECSKINNRLSLESVGNKVTGDVLNCLVLRYDIDWPSNIIITDNTLYKYNEIFKFLLKLKHGCFMLDKIWFLLGSVDKKGGSPQMRRLQICRYEVAQCLHAVQIYMTHQLHNISWHELQAALEGADSVSHLQQAHETYLNNAMERLLLGETTRAPYEIILKIFKHVTSFLRLLESARFVRDIEGIMTHPHFEKLIQRHDDFKKQAVFILKVAESSNSSGYKPYIDEFTLRLDFNHYYQSSSQVITKRRSLAGMNLLSSGSKTKLVSSLSSPTTNLARSLN